MTEPKPINVPVSNVIRFPHLHTEVDPPTAAVSRETISQIKYEHNREVTDMIYDTVLGMAGSFGYFINPLKVHEADLKMIEEVIFSSLCRYSNIEHPMHELIDTMVQDIEDDDLSDDQELVEEESTPQE